MLAVWNLVMVVMIFVSDFGAINYMGINWNLVYLTNNNNNSNNNNNNNKNNRTMDDVQS